MIQVTPNGPWGKDVHPALPITTDELMAELRRCFGEGATGVHLHVRDSDGNETLDPANVNPTCSRVHEVATELGVDVEVGLTTGAWIVPELADRLAMIREWEGVDCATVNLSEEGFEDVMGVMVEQGIGIDVGLWSASEIPLLEGSGFADRALRISIELDTGEPYFLSGVATEVSQQVNDALDELGLRCPRLTHGMNEWTWPLVEDALKRGHHTRVGFEDSVFLRDGTRAASNAELVRAAVELREGIAAARD